MRLSDIKYQTLRKALEWVKNSSDPRFENYKHMSIDDFYPHVLNGSYVKHEETKRTLRETIQIYTKQQLSLGKNMTEQEKKGIFFFPADSKEFERIMLSTPLGKEKLFFLGNYYPHLRCTGVKLYTRDGEQR